MHLSSWLRFSRTDTRQALTGCHWDSRKTLRSPICGSVSIENELQNYLIKSLFSCVLPSVSSSPETIAFYLQESFRLVCFLPLRRVVAGRQAVEPSLAAFAQASAAKPLYRELG